MSEERQPDRLRDALATLHRTAASDDFTERVLQKVARPTRRPGAGPFALAMAAATGAAAAVLFLLWLPTGPDAPQGTNPPVAQLTPLTTPTPYPAATADSAPQPALDARVEAATSRHTELQDAYRLLAELKSEHQKARAEWHELRQLAADRDPVLYLGGNDTMDLVLDLRDLPPAGARLTALPASARRTAARTY